MIDTETTEKTSPPYLSVNDFHHPIITTPTTIDHSMLYPFTDAIWHGLDLSRYVLHTSWDYDLKAS